MSRVDVNHDRACMEASSRVYPSPIDRTATGRIRRYNRWQFAEHMAGSQLGVNPGSKAWPQSPVFSF